MSGREGYHRTRNRSWRPTDRQRIVLDALVENKTNPEIAALLGTTLDGAKWHVGELMSQTGLPSREELARWWIEERQHRASLLISPLLLRWSSLSLGLGITIAVALLLLNPTGGKQPSDDGNASTVALGVDLAPTPSVTPAEKPLVPPAYYGCDVTLPNGSTPPGENPGSHYGDGQMWTVVGDDGRLFYRPVDLQPTVLSV